MEVPSGTMPKPGPFARAISGEIRSVMARKQVSGAQLATRVERSPSYISKRLRGDAAFSATDIEDICRVLEADLLLVLTAAVRASRQ